MYDEETKSYTLSTDSEVDSPSSCVHIAQLVGAYDDFQQAVLGAAQVAVDLERTVRVTHIEYDDFRGYGVWCPIAWDFASIDQAEVAMSLLGTASGHYIRLFEGSMLGEKEA